MPSWICHFKKTNYTTHLEYFRMRHLYFSNLTNVITINDLIFGSMFQSIANIILKYTDDKVWNKKRTFPASKCDK